MTNCIVCYNNSCKHCKGTACEVAVVEVGYGGSCLTYEEIDIYKEAEERENGKS